MNLPDLTVRRASCPISKMTLSAVDALQGVAVLALEEAHTPMLSAGHHHHAVGGGRGHGLAPNTGHKF